MYYVLSIIQEYQFPPLHQPTPWGLRVFPNVWPCLAIYLGGKILRSAKRLPWYVLGGSQVFNTARYYS